MTINTFYAPNTPDARLQRSQEMLSAAMEASERAEQLAGLADQVVSVHDGLAKTLEPVEELHRDHIWSGTAADQSRQRLHQDHGWQLWYVRQLLSGFATELRQAARQAQHESEQLWAQWRMAVYSGQAISRFHFWG